MNIKELLQQVKNGELEIGMAEEKLKKLPYEDIGCAKIDHHRSLRTGFGEVIYCPGKNIEHLKDIYKAFADKRENVLGTRATAEQYDELRKVLPEIIYDDMSKTMMLKYHKAKQSGCVAICTGGTSDIPVAEEAAVVAEYFGCRVNRIYDVGIAGIHRLMSKMDDIRAANCVIAVAGMEGALAGIVAGLVERPVVAVPTSVGYGASFGGIAPLLTMLNSCAEGIAVVNIDNGFGAGYLAAQMNNMVQVK